MRVLLISQFYPPEPSFSRHEIVPYLVGRGHGVTTITAFPNYPLGRVYPGYRQRLWRWEELGGARVLRLPLFPDHSKFGLRRALHYLSFAVSASCLGTALCGPADVSWVYDPPLVTGIPGLWIQRLRRVPFVFEIQDLWPDTLEATGMVRSRFVLRILNSLANHIYRQASGIIVSAPGMADTLVEKGVPRSKVHVIPNWVDETLYRPLPSDLAVAERFGMAGKFNVVFAGNLGLAQGLDTVLEAACELSSLPDIQFAIAGDGVQEEHLKDRARELGLRNVIFLGRQPPELMPRLFAASAVLLAHLRRDPLFRITIPAKTNAYLACGRPILMAVEGDAARLVDEAGAGITCKAEDPKGLADAVRRLYEMDDGQRAALGSSGRSFFLRYCSKEVLFPTYEKLLADVAGASIAPRGRSARRRERRSPQVGPAGPRAGEGPHLGEHEQGDAP